MSDEEPKKAKKIAVINYVDEAQLKKDLSYSLADLSDAMLRQSSLFAHYGMQAAKASRQVDNLKMLLDTTEAAVYRKLKDAATSAGEKTSVADLEKQIRRHAQVIAVNRALNEAKQIEAAAKTATEAFRHRRDMLIQQGLISREEMKGEAVITRRQATESHHQDLKDQYMERIKNKSEAA